MFKKIFAIVSERDFVDFRRRAYTEEMKIGEVLSALCHAYARGANIEVKKFKQKVHNKSTGVDYVHQENLEK